MRLASVARRGGLTAAALAPGFALFPLIVASVILGAGCGFRTQPAPDIRVDVAVSPTPPVVGAANRLVVTLRDVQGRPVRDASLKIEAFMSHPGMAPVIATPIERGDVYEAPLPLTMAGDWIVRVTGTVPDGRTVERQIEIVGH